MMEERLISFETAKLAKRKGFDVPCTKFSYDNDRILTDHMMRIYSDEDVFYERPTQSILQTWLRDQHDIHVYAQLGGKDENTYFTFYFKKGDDSTLNEVWHFATYEGALEEGLERALKLI